jgi:hypothetical protein
MFVYTRIFSRALAINRDSISTKDQKAIMAVGHIRRCALLAALAAFLAKPTPQLFGQPRI